MCRFNDLIMDIFVNFALAKKLKAKGFREMCLGYYRTDSSFEERDCLYLNRATQRGITYKGFLVSYNSRKEGEPFSDVIDAPTVSQVFAWFRKSHGIYAYVKRDTYHKEFRYVYDKDSPRRETVSRIYPSYDEAALKCIEDIVNKI